MARPRTLSDALADAAASGHGYIFAGPRTETFCSYRDIYDRAARLAAALQSLGLAEGDLVALILDDSAAFLGTLFGASMSGVIPASVYPPAATADLDTYFSSTARLLQRARVRALITSAKLVDAFARWRASCPDVAVVIAYETLDAIAGDMLAPSTLNPRADDIAFVQFTSGSTSAPKGVSVTHRNLSANIEAINGPACVATSQSDSAVSWLPLYHDMGLVGMALGAMYAGRPAVLLKPETFVKRPVEWFRAISRHRGTVSFAPTFAYDLCVRRVKARDLDGVDLTSWRVAGCGGEPIHAHTLAAFAESFAPFGFRASSFVPSYGLAEHVLAATMAPRGRDVRVEHLSVTDVATRAVAIAGDPASEEQLTVVSCGRPLPGHELRIVDERGEAAPERQIGEIVLSGPSVMKGYYGDEDLTNRTVRDGWLHTGDLGYIAGGELFVCGRSKDLIIINGRKHHPHDLEWAVEDLTGIRRGRVAAFASSRAGNGDRVVMIVESTGIVPAGILVDTIRRRVVDLCGLSVDEVVLVSSGTVERTTSGKVQRAAVKDRYERGEFRTRPTTV
jgi:fatty-acyl-CoA synthase